MSKIQSEILVGNCFMLILGATLIAAPFEITRHTMDGGGIMNATGGGFALSGTIGQCDAGVLTGGTFELSAGFWFALDYGDCNEDGVIGLSDHDSFVSCLNGPAVVVGSACVCFDVDGSGTVDMADFAGNQVGFTAP